ncbi:YraN family protein [Steroidobacter cummioxidans]|uniref:YraN family protein n=1 Tax=Steroidobacter cummioxidans TaxID=1803913 RepID=UPI000E31A859|nr:YraN family protein [Steroidobacter cummioxidans]
MDDRERKSIGQLGEELALAHLLAHGLTPLIRNYRCKMGELDLVMLERQTLVLIEVRCRSSTDYGGAAASVDWQKQRRLVLAAEHLLMKRAELRHYPARFDVVAITIGEPRAKVDWIRSAFSLSDHARNDR